MTPWDCFCNSCDVSYFLWKISFRAAFNCCLHRWIKVGWVLLWKWTLTCKRFLLMSIRKVEQVGVNDVIWWKWMQFPSRRCHGSISSFKDSFVETLWMCGIFGTRIWRFEVIWLHLPSRRCDADGWLHQKLAILPVKSSPLLDIGKSWSLFY